MLYYDSYSAVIDDLGILLSEKLKGAKKVLNAAALTYVATLLSSMMLLLRILIRFNNQQRKH